MLFRSRDPARLPKRLTVLTLLTRSEDEIGLQAQALLPLIRDSLNGKPLAVKTISVSSQIGSGSLPVERIPSVALVIEGTDKLGDKKVVRLEKLLRASDIPVIGRFQEKALLFDLRCLTVEQEKPFLHTLAQAVSRL